MSPLRIRPDSIGPKWQSLILAVAAGAVACGVARAIQSGWFASFALGAVLGVGVFMFWVSAEERNKTGELGRSVVTGALVGLALAGAQASANKHNRKLEAERQQWSERQSLAVTLGLQTHLRGINLEGRDLAAFYLRGKNISDARLSSADLCLANLIGTDLEESELSVAAMRRATLIEADMRRAVLWRADLEGATLVKADLQGAIMVHANLRHADLFKADLRGADLRYAQIDGADFGEAVYDASTKWPQGVNPVSLGAETGRRGRIRPQRIDFDESHRYRPRCFSIMWTHSTIQP